jgi:glycolate oxidase iron-sulfur subunit
MAEMRELIDDCVHCGFCLPACPTYDLWSEEMDSPRGRIVLMKESLEGEITPELVQHIDRCLGCLACVPACPSGVRYDLLITDMRERIETVHPRKLRERVLRRGMFAIAPHPRRLKALKPLLPIARRLPFGRLAPARADSGAPPELTPATGERRGTVALLQGCVQRAFFGNVNRAAAELLALEGFDVHAPKQPECCGALMLHAGDKDGARERARATIAALDDADHVIVTAAGCGSAMHEYPTILDGSEAFAARVKDVTELLAGLEPRTPRGPVPLRAVYHDACHHRHAQSIHAEPRALLRSIPGLELLEADGPPHCCGSAGTYNVLQPEAAAELGRRAAERLLATGAEAIVTANPGCALQLAAHARELSRDIPVYHPVELVLRACVSAG